MFDKSFWENEEIRRVENLNLSLAIANKLHNYNTSFIEIKNKNWEYNRIFKKYSTVSVKLF